MNAIAVLTGWAVMGAAAAPDGEASHAACAAQAYEGADYVVCRFDPDTSDMRLFLYDDEGAPYSHFDNVKEALAEDGERLVFAMNAGMYHEDRSPVGLYYENGEEPTPLNLNDGPGNFHMKPNGVFWLFRSVDPGEPEPWPPYAAIATTQGFEGAHAIAYATQSGPMLVIDGEIHPRFIPDSDSLRRRNGVGVTAAGGVVFVLADSPVNFYDFAVFLRDELKTRNALYLDGTISRIYAPSLGRNDPGIPMGPIVGVVAPVE